MAWKVHEIEGIKHEIKEFQRQNHLDGNIQGLIMNEY